MRRTLLAAITIGTSFLAPDAFAHTPLTASTPAAGSTVSAPVTQIVLEFGGDVRLTALVLADEAGAPKRLGEVPKDIAKQFTIPVREALGAGAYTATWRAVGADTHVVSGEIRFTVAAPASH